jgi:hypothetical protein
VKVEFMTEKKWFSMIGEQISGPFTGSEIIQKIDVGELKEALFWARGKTAWLNANDFRHQLLKDQEDIKNHLKTQSEDRQWKLKNDQTEVTGLSYSQMIDYLKNKPNYAHIMVWTEGYEDWREVYQIHKILDDLGTSRRQHQRVPIDGMVAIEHLSGSLVCPLTSISEGGFGAKDCFKLSIGETLRGTINSSQLATKVYFAAECVYTGTEGYIGIRFINISTESKMMIIEYVKKFLSTQSQSAITP